MPTRVEAARTAPNARERVLPQLVITHWPALSIWIVASGLLIVHARSYMPFFVDDAFISLRYAQRLVEGHGLTWTDGPPVEGYTNLLWVLLVAGIGAFDVSLIEGARVLGVLCTLAMLAAFATDLRSLKLREQPSTMLACGLVAGSGSLSAWAIGGLEQPLVLALLCWSLVLLRRVIADPAPLPRTTLLWTGGLLALLALSRADGAIYTVAITLGLLVTRGMRRGTWREASLVSALPVIAVLAQLAFRLAYYDDYVPNTFRVKVAPTVGRLEQGWDYVVRAMEAHETFLIAGTLLTLVALVDRSSRRRTALVLICWLTWTVYITVVGGDFFPQRRQLLPSVALMAWMIADGVLSIVRLRGRWTVVGTLLAALVLSQHALAQDTDPERDRALKEYWHWGGRPIGRFLEKHFAAAQPLLAVDAAGSLPFHARLPALDMLGLNDRYLAHHRPEDFGKGFIGHELGDAEYVLSRKPDLIAFWGPHGSRTGRWKAGIDLLKRPEFHALYLDVELRTPTGDRSVLWIRREGRVGVQRSKERVVVPGYLMTQPDGFSHEDAGRLGLVMNSVRPAVLRGIPLDKGRWSLTVQGVKTDVLRCRVSTSRHRSTVQSLLPVPLVIDDDTFAPTVMCTLPSGAWSHVAALTFTRQP